MEGACGGGEADEGEGAQGGCPTLSGDLDKVLSFVADEGRKVWTRTRCHAKSGAANSKTMLVLRSIDMVQEDHRSQLSSCAVCAACESLAGAGRSTRFCEVV